jgi:hypothetical protein
MASEKEFTINPETLSAQREVPPHAGAAPLEASGIETIATMIADREVPVADISRLIALEIVGLMRKMAPKDPAERGIISQRDLNDQVKAYRELQRTLTESEALAKKDVLNIDGDKFKFVYGEILKYFQLALKGGGIDDELAKNILMQFRDIVSNNEAGLRIDINKIGTGR